MYTVEDSTKSEVQAYFEDLMLGSTRRADDPEDDDELESQGFVIKQGPGVLRHARRESMIETTDAEDPNPSYIFDWGRGACIAITDADPDPEAEH